MAKDVKVDIPLGIDRPATKYEQARTASLIIRTSKDLRGRLGSDGIVMWEGDHSRSHAFGLGGGGDFSKTLFRTPGKVTATQKAIDGQHATVFTPEVVAALKAEAIAWYAEGKDKR